MQSYISTSTAALLTGENDRRSRMDGAYRNWESQQPKR